MNNLIKAREARKEYINSKQSDKETKIKELVEAINKEQIDTWTKEYRKKNKQLIAEQKKKYYVTNKEHLREANKKWEENNKEQRVAFYKAWAEANSDYLKQKRKKYYEQAPDAYLIRKHRCKVIPPQELIEAMRVKLFIQRELKEIKNETHQ
jgi:hypothetical protein